MFDFHEKRKIRNIVYSKFTIGVLLLLIGLMGMSVFERFVALRTISEKREIKEEEVMLLNERAAALESDVEYLKKGRGVEEELRNRFDVAREGGRVVVIVGEEEEGENIDALAIPPGTEENSRAPWWQFFKFW